MPFAASRGQQIHYEVEGGGPLVILQHGLLSSCAGWKQFGVVDALSDAYQVARVDSLGHGASDKPTHPDRYRQAERAGDLVAVMDDLDAKRAHVVGYSMGGWMAVGVAKYFPERLASLTIAGWDLVSGMETARPAFRGDFSFDGLLKSVRGAAPQLADWVTPEVEPGLRACWDAVHDLDGGREAVLALECPVLLWDGRDDFYHDPMQAFAARHGLRFLSTGGDHLTAMAVHGPEVAAGLRAFLGGV